jgi:hypothetical protein
MLPFPATHAVALTQAKQAPTKAARGRADAQPVHSVRKSILRRVLEALAEARRRKAVREANP